MVNNKVVQSEKGLRVQIKRNLNKEIHPATKPSIDFIHKILTDAYESGMVYDVTDMRNAVLAFAANSTNQAEYCIKLVNKMPFKSADAAPAAKNETADLVFYDVEVFPNLFLVNWKFAGSAQPVVRMINPTSEDIEGLMKFRLIGFNCRRYDNHILYARLMGYTNEQLYNLSQRIIGSEKKSKSNNCFFGEAYNVSYTDVYDFCSKKQSLKKWEIELGIHHQELGLPWDQPVPESMWQKVAEYCDNDVIATEAVFNARKADFIAREILADVAGMTVNDTTNTLTAKIIFGGNKKPQDQFNYRDMGDASQICSMDDLPFKFGPEEYDNYTAFDKKDVRSSLVTSSTKASLLIAVKKLARVAMSMPSLVCTETSLCWILRLCIPPASSQKISLALSTPSDSVKSAMLVLPSSIRSSTRLAKC